MEQQRPSESSQYYIMDYEFKQLALAAVEEHGQSESLKARIEQQLPITMAEADWLIQYIPLQVYEVRVDGRMQFWDWDS